MIFFCLGLRGQLAPPRTPHSIPQLLAPFIPTKKKKRKLHNNKQFAEPPFMLKRQSYLGSVVRRRRTSRFKHAMPPKNKTNTSTNPYSFFGGGGLPKCTTLHLAVSHTFYPISLSLSLSLSLWLSLCSLLGRARERGHLACQHTIPLYTHNHYDKHFYVFFYINLTRSVKSGRRSAG